MFSEPYQQKWFSSNTEARVIWGGRGGEICLDSGNEGLILRQ
jgi:hypothetical protein